MAVQILMPNQRQQEKAQPEETALEKVLKGMQILQAGASAYGSISGGLAAGKNADTNAMQANTQKAQADYEMKGGLTGKDALQYGENYSYSDQESPNAIPVTIGEQKRFATPKQKQAESILLSQKDMLNTPTVPAGTKGAREVSYIGADGSPQRAFILPKEKTDAFGDLAKQLSIQNSQLDIKKKTNELDPNQKTYDQSQNQAAGFATRAEASEAKFNDMLERGYDPNAFFEKVKNIGADAPLIGQERFRTDDRTTYDALKRNFISAVLRKESGAAISNEEYANEDKKYFPQPGDGAEALAFKAQARQDAIETLKMGAGGAYDKMAGRTGKPIGDPQSQSPQTDLASQIAAEKERRKIIRAQAQGNTFTKPASFK